MHAVAILMRTFLLCAAERLQLVELRICLGNAMTYGSTLSCNATELVEKKVGRPTLRKHIMQ